MHYSFQFNSRPDSGYSEAPNGEWCFERWGHKLMPRISMSFQCVFVHDLRSPKSFALPIWKWFLWNNVDAFCTTQTAKLRAQKRSLFLLGKSDEKQNWAPKTIPRLAPYGDISFLGLYGLFILEVAHQSLHFVSLAAEGFWARRTAHRTWEGRFNSIVGRAIWISFLFARWLCAFNEEHKNLLGLQKVMYLGPPNCRPADKMIMFVWSWDIHEMSALHRNGNFQLSDWGFTRSDGCCPWMRDWKRTGRRRTRSW